MDDVAPLGDAAQPARLEPAPAAPSAPAAAGGMLGMVMPAPPQPTNRAALDSIRRVLGELVAWAVVALALVLLLTPALVLLAAGGWAIVTYITSAVTLYHLLVASRLADLLGPLQALDLAGRVAATSAGYYALLCGLLVLEAGLLGKRWRRLFLFPGIVLSLPAALAFYFALRLLLDAMNATHPLSLAAQTGLTLYLLLDAAVLAAYLVDLSPKPRRTRTRRRQHRWRAARRGLPAPLGQPASPSLPLVHFGPPSVPLTPTTPAPGAPRIRTVPVITAPDIPAILPVADLCPPPEHPNELRRAANTTPLTS